MGNVEWIQLAQGPMLSFCKHGDKPSGCDATELVSYLLS
jgi:hypothetical protein